MNRLPYLALLAQVLISALTYLVAKSALASFGPLEVMLLRAAGSAPLFALLLWFMPAPRLPRRDEWLPIIMLGLLGAPLNQGFFLVGLESSTPSHAALLYALTPLLVFIIAALAGHERPSRIKLLGIALAFAGVLIVLSERGLMQQGAVLRGDLLIFVGVLSWAVYSIWGRQRASVHGAIRVTSWTILAGTLMSLPLGAFVLEPAHLAAASATAWAGIAYLCVMTSFVAYLLWYAALARIEASKATVWSNLQPVATAALSYIVYATPISSGFALGGVLVLSGVVLTQRG